MTWMMIAWLLSAITILVVVRKQNTEEKKNTPIRLAINRKLFMSVALKIISVLGFQQE